ncbi:MAG: hypothetical protein GF368_05645 [Candidatus Aenigmarchaeota archaeon]|nr:hypothetical protein [Candidatus Aenigmarchaeota archaeon]
MDEFIFVLMAGLLMIGILLVAWGEPGEGGINGTQIVVENPFSIGMFPKDVPRQISLGDFTVSYAIGSEVIETKRNLEIEGKDVSSMTATMEQDISMVTGGFLNIYVRETNQKGELIITFNQEEVFNQKATVGKIEIPINKELIKDYNVIEIKTSGSGFLFFSKPQYTLEKVEFGLNFYGNVEKFEEFYVYPEDLNNFRNGEISFRLDKYTGDGDLIIDINSYRIYKGQPSLNFYQSFDQYDVGLRNGVNTISFSAESGATYEIEDAVITIIRQEKARKSRTFDFTVGNSWNDNLEGEISFLVTDTDFQGNLLVTITDANGKQHPTEALQSYSIGETKTININKDYVGRGENKVTFEASGGNFVISNVEITPK